MWCIKRNDDYLAWTLSFTEQLCEDIYRENDPGAGWALIMGAKPVEVTVIIMEKGSITNG